MGFSMTNKQKDNLYKVLRGLAAGLIAGLCLLLWNGPLFAAEAIDVRRPEPAFSGIAVETQATEAVTPSAEYRAGSPVNPVIPEKHKLISNEWHSGIEHVEVRIRAAIGQVLLVKLVWDNEPDCRWDLVESESAPEDAARGHVVEQDGVIGFEPAPVQQGSPSRQGMDYFVFEARNIGTQRLVFAYAKEWAQDAPVRSRFVLNLDISEADVPPAV